MKPNQQKPIPGGDIDCPKCGYHYPSTYSECTVCHGTGKQNPIIASSQQEKCRCCGSSPDSERAGYHCPHCPLSSPRQEAWAERFDKKFNHFNDLYIGHDMGTPDVGKQIDDWDCSNCYDLKDVKEFLRQELLSSRREDIRKFREMLDKEIQGTVMEHEGQKFVSTNTKQQVAVNQALSNVASALSTWEEAV